MNTAQADMNTAPHYRIPPSRGCTAPHYRIPPFSTHSNTEHAGIIVINIRGEDILYKTWRLVSNCRNTALADQKCPLMN